MVKKFNRQNFKKRQNKFVKDPIKTTADKNNNNNNNYDSDEDVDYEQNEKLIKEISDGYIILDKVNFKLFKSFFKFFKIIKALFIFIILQT